MDNKLKAATGGSKTEPGKATAGGKRPGENTLAKSANSADSEGQVWVALIINPVQCMCVGPLSCSFFV